MTLSTFLLITVLVLSLVLAQVYSDREKLRQELHRYQYLISQEDFQSQLDLEIRAKQNEVNRLIDERDKLGNDVLRLRQEVSVLYEEEYVQSFGFYQPRYDFISAGNYNAQLQRVKLAQGKMISTNEAIICYQNLFLRKSENDSEKQMAKEGQTLTDNFRKLVLKIFNAECDDFISKVKYSSNVNQIEEKIRKRFAKLNKTSEVISCEITTQYLNLKLQELHLQYNMKCEEQEERERERSIREERQERQKIEKLMKAAEEAEERENRYQQELENALREQKLAMGAEWEKQELLVQQLRANLAKATSEKEKANSQAAMTKAGYIYVISNTGSFGRDIYRICMTKKSGDPDEYVNSMNPVVPFPFDIHLKFVAENALDTLAKLQQRFADKRVNKVRNERKGFFRVPLEEIIQAVEDIKQDGDLKSIYPIKTVQAYEYYRSQSIERKEKQNLDSINTDLDNETA